ncbi:flavin monoamine oxidase family protein [Aspergillus homomorphus CBS 101889]|uniref:monoamine oxidase n=1 Tax=Aspergillus homomorphus (strain CBS 101889) TaxID=1450537 RepID=A0A395HGV4_ASPHC|nr:FAD/NAD(P)-binding domain-containing protein [Aspergillus homomorphus CBS 101889]RAL07142.1 FAD/NAD(P)-binding domain-containing protein [Aspergillus homomorphus CBS 101889]
MTGLRVLIIEARDRIGGRSWSSNIGGYPFEMRGTWVHWGQSHVWREISRYQMRHELEPSFDSPTDYAVSHNAFHVPAAHPYDSLSAQDRLNEVATSLTLDERAVLESFILLCSCGTLETTSFFEFLHGWALSGYSYQGCMDYYISYKCKRGQSSFAINFFKEVLSTGNLLYAFNSLVQSIKDESGKVTVSTRNGHNYTATRLISTITFPPPLGPQRTTAINIGHVSQCVKVHAEISSRAMRSWRGISYPSNKLFYAIGDGTTPAGTTHVVCFGRAANHIQPEENLDTTKEAVRAMALRKMSIKRSIFQNWSKDEFAKGDWFFAPPKLLSTSLDKLHSQHGNVLFAKSDWDVGWRSFNDGAIEVGTRAAKTVTEELRSLSTARAHL